MDRIDAHNRRKTLDFAMMRIDEGERARKTPRAQIADDHAAD